MQQPENAPHGGLTTGDRIAHVRKRRRMSRKRLATLAGVSSKSIGRYERDEVDVPSDTLARIALALGTTTDYLLGLTDDPGVRDPDSPTRVWLNPAA